MNQYYFIKPLASPRDARELTIHLKKQTEQTPFSIFGWRRDGDEANICRHLKMTAIIKPIAIFYLRINNTLEKANWANALLLFGGEGMGMRQKKSRANARDFALSSYRSFLLVRQYKYFPCTAAVIGYYAHKINTGGYKGWVHIKAVSACVKVTRINLLFFSS